MCCFTKSDGTAVDVVETHDQIHQCGLARTGGTHDGNGAAGTNFQIQVVDQWTILRVAEGHIFEFQTVRASSNGVGLRRITVLFVFVDKLKNALGAGHAGLQQVGHGTQLRQRLGELA